MLLKFRLWHIGFEYIAYYIVLIVHHHQSCAILAIVKLYISLLLVLVISCK